MSNYMIPVNKEFVDDIARSIAKSRIEADTMRMVQQRGLDKRVVTESLDAAFNRLWDSFDESDIALRDAYIEEARAAISAINLKMLTMCEE